MEPPFHYRVFTSARGIASLWVMLLHFSVMVSQYSNTPLSSLFEFGTSRVYFFFVISGFFMMHIYGNKLHSPDLNAFSFIKKRASRIYPLWWCALCFMCVITFFSHSREFYGIENTIKQILLVTPEISEDGKGRLLGVSWTLEYEIIFYCLFSLLFITKNKQQEWGLLLSGGLIAFVSSPTFGLFLAGIFAAKLLKQRPELKSDNFAIPLLTLSLILYTETLTLHDYVEKALFAFLFFTLLISLAMWERGRKHSLTPPRWLKETGTYSYSIYLFHIPIGSVTLKIFLINDWVAGTNGYITLTGLSVITWLGCILIGRLVEKPINNYVKSRF